MTPLDLTGTEMVGKEQASISRLEWALRVCCKPKQRVRFLVDDALIAQATFNRMCELIPRRLVKRYGLLSVIFENDSHIEIACR